MSAIPYAGADTLAPIGPLRRFFSRYLGELSVAFAYALLLAYLWQFRPAFFQAQGQAQSQFRQLWVSAAPILVAAVGMTLVILARHIDISIGSQFSVCGIVGGMLAAHHVPMAGVVVGMLLAGAIMGAVNGALVAGMGMPSIVVTLATMVIIGGALTWMTQGAAVRLPDGFQWFGDAQLAVQRIIQHVSPSAAARMPHGVSQQAGQYIIVGVAVVVFLIFAWSLRWLSAGRAIYAVGSDQEAARLAGIRPRWVVFNVFVLMGVLTAVAALLNATQFIIIYPDAGKDLELGVIAAVVVGGTAITGGRGTLIGTLIGVALLATIGPALIYFHAHSKLAGPEWSEAIQGFIVLAAVAFGGLQRRTTN